MAQRIKIIGNDTWDVSEFTEDDDEKQYHRIYVSSNIIQGFKSSEYKPYLGRVSEIYIEQYWAQNAESIIRQLFTLKGWCPTLQGANFIDVKNFGCKTLTVEYKKQIHHLKLPYCCAGACTAFEASDSGSGERIKMFIKRLMKIVYTEQCLSKSQDDISLSIGP